MKKNMAYRYWNMGKRTLPLCLFTLLLFVCSCSENEDSVEEYPDWKATNETYWENLYQTTKQKIAAGDDSWKIIPKYSYVDREDLQATDYVIAHVKETGEGAMPIYTDTVRVHYSGHLLPSTSYSAGYKFDYSYDGDLNTATATPRKFGVAGLVSGWTTALMNMHVGDRWDLYVPYQLGYGTSKNDAIPGYSTLIFDLMLVQVWHAGEKVK